MNEFLAEFYPADAGKGKWESGKAGRKSQRWLILLVGIKKGQMWLNELLAKIEAK